VGLQGTLVNSISQRNHHSKRVWIVAEGVAFSEENQNSSKTWKLNEMATSRAPTAPAPPPTAAPATPDARPRPTGLLERLNAEAVSLPRFSRPIQQMQSRLDKACEL